MKRTLLLMSANRNYSFSVDEEVLDVLYAKASEHSKATGKSSSSYVNDLLKKALSEVVKVESDAPAA